MWEPRSCWGLVGSLTPNTAAVYRRRRRKKDEERGKKKKITVYKSTRGCVELPRDTRSASIVGAVLPTVSGYNTTLLYYSLYYIKGKGRRISTEDEP